MPQASAGVPSMVQEQKRRKVSQSLEGRTYAASVEVRDPFVYYDTHVLDAATGTVVLFNNASGTKPKSQTNYLFQQLPAGQAMDVYGLRVMYYAHAAVDDAGQLALMTWLNRTVIQVAINNKVPSYERTLAGLIGGQIQAVTAPAVTVNSKNLSQWTANTIVQFKKKIYIDQNIQWTVSLLREVANAAALTGDYLRVETIGRLTAQL